ncbi:MAG TPA: carboxypeptidase-like regulatory domain-containing protein [Terriglobia bacterium]|nr:carboxypeptidase-like regulatory domain-containing protein [Terriglobia bacterium]
MKNSVLILCAAALLSAGLGIHAATTPQGAPGRDIRTSIIDGLTGQPVTRVRYVMTGGGLVDGATGTGDDQGNLVLAAVRPGNYRVTVEKAGFFPEVYDLNVTASSPATLPQIVMTAKREISGSVRWQDGEPAARAQVRVFGVRGGKTVARQDIPPVQANDRGEFVVSNLRPGRYILLIAPTTFTGGIDASGQFAPGGIPRLGLPVYYPGVNVPDVRSVIDVRGALTMQNVTVILEEKKGVLVEGQVVPSSTVPIGGEVAINLSNQGLFSISTRARAGETFRVGPIPEGFYVLDASSQGAQPGRTLIPVTIGGTTFRGIAVSIPPPVFLNGMLEMDDPNLRPSATITLQSDRTPGTLTGTVAQTGEFRIARAVGGETYGMSIDPRSLPPNTYIAAVSQGTQQMATSPFQVAAGGDPVRIALKTDGATVEGSVKEAGRAVGQAFVVLAPKDRRAQHHFRTTTANLEGAFKLTAIAPGEYDLIAFDRNEDDDYLDEIFLQRFADRLTQAKIAASSTGKVELALVRIPRR